LYWGVDILLAFLFVGEGFFSCCANAFFGPLYTSGEHDKYFAASSQWSLGSGLHTSVVEIQHMHHALEAQYGD
jgi:hypothetical protein